MSVFSDFLPHHCLHCFCFINFRSRLEDRSTEFERLRCLHLKDTQENLSLKARYHELQEANNKEKMQLESHMKHVIHSQEGQLNSAKQKISHLQSALQGELSLSQNKIAEQEKEIKWLKK